MIANPMEMRALSMELGTSVWTLAALAALFESGVAGQLAKEPRTLDDLARGCSSMSRTRIERCLAAGAAAGVVVAENERYRLADGAMPFAGPMRAVLEGDLRSQLMQALCFVDAARGDRPREDSWAHTDPRILQAQGDASAGFVPAFKMMILPQLGELAARLDGGGAAMLDVGVGVASLAIGMCRAFPKLRVVGLDAFEPPLALARENVAKAGLGDRIELRKEAVDTMRDESAFDLAWLPSFFIGAALPAAVKRVCVSLKPAGWMLFPISASGGDARHRAAHALVADVWGGPSLSTAEAESLLSSSGFSTVRVLPGPPWAPATLAAQR